MQRIPSYNMVNGNKFKSETKSAVCGFYQRSMCQKDRDHETAVPFMDIFALLVLQWGRKTGICPRIAVSTKPANNE